jgi:RNA-directed DNA polymerase
MAVMKQIAYQESLYTQGHDMTTSLTGAPSHTDDEWHNIDWRKVHQNVRRLQARIVKATQAGRWGKVKALQRLLTRSYSAKALAVKRVTENKGKRTPGVDGETWSTPASKTKAIKSLNQSGYRALPLRRVYIPKSNGKKRPLGIPIMKDRAMQALYLLAVDPIAETIADPNSYGFRLNRAPADAIEQCFLCFHSQDRAEWILEADIHSCFDNISHEWLEQNIPIEKPILRQWLKTGYLEKQTLHPTEAGTPQGGIISPVLMNLTLNGLEAMFLNKYPKNLRHGWEAKVNVIRFADDFIIGGNSKELLENEVLPMVREFLQERGLTLSEAKTSITHIEKGFDFLGQNIRRYNNGSLFIKPSKKSIKALLKKVRNIINRNKQATAGHLIMQLNPVIRGWAYYHKSVVSKKIFDWIDSQIFHALWRWALRRHNKKSKRKIREKYFKTVGNRNWVFYGEIIGKGGKPRQIHLFHAAKVPIKRHTKIIGTANPYSPEWESYFEQRIAKKMEDELAGKRRLLYLWQEQNGICPICQQKITEQTGWNLHHIIWRVYGGSDKLENCILLHPNCHRLVHSRKLKVEKPRPSTDVREA